MNRNVNNSKATRSQKAFLAASLALLFLLAVGADEVPAENCCDDELADVLWNLFDEVVIYPNTWSPALNADRNFEVSLVSDRKAWFHPRGASGLVVRRCVLTPEGTETAGAVLTVFIKSAGEFTDGDATTVRSTLILLLNGMSKEWEPLLKKDLGFGIKVIRLVRGAGGAWPGLGDAVVEVGAARVPILPIAPGSVTISVDPTLILASRQPL